MIVNISERKGTLRFLKPHALRFCRVSGRKEKRKKERENNAKFSGHCVRQRTHNNRGHALRSDQQLKNAGTVPVNKFLLAGTPKNLKFQKNSPPPQSTH